MPKVVPGRFAAKIEGEFVVFLIGMRVNQLWAVNKWWPASQSMPKMLKELAAQPELGLLHAEYFLSWRTASLFQYWRSYEQLQAYAHARDKEHLPAWAAFNKAARGNEAVGIYHETYIVKPGEYESIYADMPSFGLARAGVAVPAVGSMQSAAGRMGRGPEAVQPPL